MKLPHTEVKFYSEVKSQTGLSSLRVSCKRVLKSYYVKEKVIPLREVLSNAPIDVLCEDETKQVSSFPDHQFKIEGYQFPPFRRDRNSKGGEN